MTQDSTVTPREVLDEEFAIHFDQPWLHELPTGDIETYATEDEACAAQRAYRASVGLDPMTGEGDE